MTWKDKLEIGLKEEAHPQEIRAAERGLSAAAGGRVKSAPGKTP